MKLHLLAAAATVLAAPAAIAGPYVNLESNSGFVGSDYGASILEAHVGADITLSDSASAYIQAGPAFTFPDGGESDTELSGKAGVNVALSDKLGAYGEYAFITNDEGLDDLGQNVKLGLKYSF